MLSKNMYLVLSCLPRNYSEFTYSQLLEKCKLSDDDIKACLNEMLFMEKKYIRTSKESWEKCQIFLTEYGLVGLETYEQEKKNTFLVKASLITAICAMVASVASAVAAFLTLLV